MPSSPTYITAWFHVASDPDDPSAAERATVEKQVAAFNRSQGELRARLITLPRGEYNLVVFAMSTVTGTFNNVAIVRIRVV